MNPATSTPARRPPLPDPLGEAARRLGASELLAYPTETVWGLGADARSERGLSNLRQFKGRDDGKPISVLVGRPDRLEAHGFRVDAGAAALAERFWPGPLTLVLPHAGGFARGVARAEDGAVGVRCSAHPLAAALALRLETEGLGPVTATSLNRSGDPAARTALDARIVCTRARSGSVSPTLLPIEGAEAGGELESTVLDLTGERPRVLRWGALPEAELSPVLTELYA